MFRIHRSRAELGLFVLAAVCSVANVRAQSPVAATPIARAPSTTPPQPFSQCNTSSVPLQPTAWSSSVTFPRFDPANGVLVGLQLSLNAHIEGQARAEYGDAVRVFSSAFVPMYYAPVTRKRRAAMKLVTVGPEQRIVGLHVVGQGADEMLQGFAVAVRMGATKRDFDDTVAIHPTASEEFVTMR